MRQHHEVLRTFIVLVEPPQDACRDKLAQYRPGIVDILTILKMRLLIQELGAIDKQTIDCGSVLG